MRNRLGELESSKHQYQNDLWISRRKKSFFKPWENMHQWSQNGRDVEWDYRSDKMKT